jgi:hypothetical protein
MNPVLLLLPVVPDPVERDVRVRWHRIKPAARDRIAGKT